MNPRCIDRSAEGGGRAAKARRADAAVQTLVDQYYAERARREGSAGAGCRRSANRQAARVSPTIGRSRYVSALPAGTKQYVACGNIAPTTRPVRTTGRPAAHNADAYVSFRRQCLRNHKKSSSCTALAVGSRSSSSMIRRCSEEPES